MGDSPPSLKIWAPYQRDNPLATIEEFNEVFNTAPEGGGVKMEIKTIQGVSSKPTKKKPDLIMWSVMIDGTWWSTIRDEHVEVVRTLRKGDKVNITLVERGNFKNIDAIEPVVDVNEEIPEWDDGEPMPEPPPEPKKTTKWAGKKTEESRNGSFALSYAKDVAVAMITVTGKPDCISAQDILTMATVFKGWLDES